MRSSEALAYLSTSSLNYEIVYFDKAVDQKNALYNGEVNLISSVSLSPVANSRTVAQFAPCPLLFCRHQGEHRPYQEADATIEKVNQADPKLQDSLYDEYVLTVEDAFLLTDRQKESLSSMGAPMFYAWTTIRTSATVSAPWWTTPAFPSPPFTVGKKPWKRGKRNTMPAGNTAPLS